MTLSTNPETAVLQEQVKNLNEKIDDLETLVREMQKQVGELHDMASRWKGAFIVILAVGSALGWIVNFSDKILKPFH